MSEKEIPEFIRAFMAGQSTGKKRKDSEDNTLTDEEILGRLQAMSMFYDMEFKAGDIVTPRDFVNLRGNGAPHVVVEVCPKYTYVSHLSQVEPSKNVNEDPLVPLDWDVNNGRPVNSVRVLGMRGDQIVPMWYEPWQIMPWAGPRTKKFGESEGDKPDVHVMKVNMDDDGNVVSTEGDTDGLETLKEILSRVPGSAKKKH